MNKGELNMERKLATVETILEIQPIPNADNIVKARVRNWWVVIGKDQFKVGEKCIYFEIDSLLPTSNPRFNGLGKYNTVKYQDGVFGYRIRTVKLRNQISQGLVLPYSGNSDIGTDLTEELGIIKYDPYEDPKIRLSSDNGAEGLFPSFIPKTDEERIQNIDIENLRGKKFVCTEKLDGTSFTAYKKDGQLKVCSRNLILREDENSIYWKIARKYNLDEIVPENVAIQGEIVGEGIQGNPLRLKEQDLYVFYMYAFHIGEYFHIDIKGLKYVPILEFKNEYGIWYIDNNITIDDLIERSNGLKSKLNKDRLAEGMVYHRINEYGNKESFKVINNKYLLKEK